MGRFGPERKTIGDVWLGRPLRRLPAINQHRDHDDRGRFESQPDRSRHLFDQVVAASLIDPTLVTTDTLYVDVDVDIDSGIN